MSDEAEWLLTACVEQADAPGHNPIVFNVHDDGDWTGLRDTLLNEFHPHQTPSGKVIPENFVGVTVRLVPMTRPDFDALNEHSGW